MFDKIKRLGTDTAIYGISTILGRFLNFLLTPFYTNVLASTSDYGIVTYIFSLIAFVNVVYNYGMESAFFKYYSSEEIGTKKQSFSIPFFSILGTSVIFTAIILGLQGTIADLLHIPAELHSVIPMTAVILACDALTIIPFAALRMERKSKTFALLKLGNIVISVVMNVILLVVFRMGVTGIFISALVASIATLIFLLPVIVRNITPEWSGELLKTLLRFGLPSIPAGLAAAAVNVIDRPILRAMTNDSVVGIYQANYRLGVIMMIMVSMYDYAWKPFFFSTSKDPEAKQIFSRIFTYVTLVMAGIFLLLSLFIDNIVKLSFFGHSFIRSDYWSGLGIVPVVLLGYVFYGMYINFSAGIYIEKKTHLLPSITIVGALTNVLVNYTLIPSLGMLGAAWATFFAYFAMAVMTYFIVQRVYPVMYEFGRIGKIVLATAIVYGLYSFVSPPIPELLYKAVLCIIFLALMYIMRFFDQRELKALRRVLQRTPARPPKTPSEADPAGGLGA